MRWGIKYLCICYKWIIKSLTVDDSSGSRSDLMVVAHAQPGRMWILGEIMAVSSEAASSQHVVAHLNETSQYSGIVVFLHGAGISSIFLHTYLLFGNVKLSCHFLMYAWTSNVTWHIIMSYSSDSESLQQHQIIHAMCAAAAYNCIVRPSLAHVYLTKFTVSHNISWHVSYIP